MAKHRLLREINRARVMNAIRVHSPVSRAEIARLTALDKKSVTNVVTDLLDEQMVLETGRQSGEQGRPVTLLELNRRGKLVLGVGLSERRATGVLVDLYGRPVGVDRCAVAPDGSIETTAATLRRVYQWAKRRAAGRLIGVGLAAPGVIDCDTGRVHQSVNLPSIEGANLLDATRFIEEPIVLEESSRCKALAEKWFGAGRGCPQVRRGEAASFVCIDLGIGIGAGFIQDRRLYARGPAPVGELGHLCIQPRGRPCRCGNRGCLETYLAEPVVLDEINKAANTGYDSLASVDRVDPKAKPALRRAGRRLGHALAAVLNLFCPPLLVMAGPLVREPLGAVVMPAMRRGLDEQVLAACLEATRVVVSELDHARELGAAARWMARLFEVEEHCYV